MKFSTEALTTFNLIFLTTNVLFWNMRMLKQDQFIQDGNLIHNFLHEPTSSFNDYDDSGWKTINVYYGIRETLPPPIITEPIVVGSQIGQDRLITALMKEFHSLVPATDTQKRHNFFVDLAANDALYFSNTNLLEKHDWTGLCIEPNPGYWERLAHRKCTVVGAYVGGQDLHPVNVTLPINKAGLGGIVGEDLDNKPEANETTKLKYTVSLRTVFDRYHVPSEIDYLSLDVEGAESMIMKDFPYDEYTFRFMTVERPKDDLKAILKSNGYEYIQTVSSWGETLWVHESVLQLGLSKELIQALISTNIIVT